MLRREQQNIRNTTYSNRVYPTNSANKHSCSINDVHHQGTPNGGPSKGSLLMKAVQSVRDNEFKAKVTYPSMNSKSSQRDQIHMRIETLDGSGPAFVCSQLWYSSLLIPSPTPLSSRTARSSLGPAATGETTRHEGHKINRAISTQLHSQARQVRL
jgi:hypothetical protein